MKTKMVQIAFGISCLLIGASWCWDIDIKHLLAWVFGVLFLLVPFAGVMEAWKKPCSSTTSTTPTHRHDRPGRGVRAARRR